MVENVEVYAIANRKIFIFLGPSPPPFSPHSICQVIYSPDTDIFFFVNNIKEHTKYFTGETPLFTQSLHQHTAATAAAAAAIVAVPLLSH